MIERREHNALGWGLRDMAWSRDALLASGANKQLERVHPSAIFVPDDMAPRSAVVYENIRMTMEVMGQLVPLLVSDDYRLIDGISRLRAAEDLGHHEVMVVRVSGLSELEELVVRVTSNGDFTRAQYTVLESYELWKRVHEGLAKRASENQLKSRFGAPDDEPPAEPVGDARAAASRLAGISVGVTNQLRELEHLAGDVTVREEVRDAAKQALSRVAETNKVGPHWREVRALVDQIEGAEAQPADAGFQEADRFQHALSRAEELLLLDLDTVRGFLSDSGQLAGYRARARAIAVALERFAGGGSSE